MADRTVKRYFWNENARTHGMVIGAFLIMSNLMGMVIAGTSALMLMRYATFTGTVDGMMVLIATALLWAGLSLCLFLVMVSAYSHLIESQVINPPTPQPTIIDRTVTREYHQTGTQTKLKR